MGKITHFGLLHNRNLLTKRHKYAYFSGQKKALELVVPMKTEVRLAGLVYAKLWEVRLSVG